MATLADGLRAWAHDDRQSKAAVELLIEHGFWLGESEFTAAVVDQVDDDFARILWSRLPKFIDSANDVNTYAGAAEWAVLRVAEMLGGNRSRLSSLDQTNRALVVKAFADALGVEEIGRA